MPILPSHMLISLEDDFLNYIMYSVNSVAATDQALIVCFYFTKYLAIYMDMEMIGRIVGFLNEWQLEEPCFKKLHRVSDVLLRCRQHKR